MERARERRIPPDLRMAPRPAAIRDGRAVRPGIDPQDQFLFGLTIAQQSKGKAIYRVRIPSAKELVYVVVSGV